MNHEPTISHWLRQVALLVVVMLTFGGWAGRAAEAPADLYSVSISDATFPRAVAAVEKATPYSLSYSTADIPADCRITIRARRASIKVIMAQMLRGLGMQYKIDGRHIVLQRTDSRAASGATVPGGRRVTGVVTDASGEALPGAVVNIKGTNVNTVTDLDGRYSITVADDTDEPTLHVSYVGYAPRTFKLPKGQDSADFSLAEDASSSLDEVVVIGYGSIKKESVTSAISTLGADKLSKTLAINTSGAVAGKIAGVNFRQTDGRPGATTSINIRNMGTPLFVVDGVQMDEGQFNNIDFNDIESISVLKDGSAAIYGVRAANGVVVVTTKRGQRGQKCTVNINANYGWQSVFRYPQPADAATFVRARVQAATIQGTTQQFTPEEYALWQEGKEPGYQSFDWKKFVLRNNAPQYNISASASGGSDHVNYYFGLGHTRQESLVNDYGYYERTNMQMNIDADISPTLRVMAQVNGRVEDNVTAAFNSYLSGHDGYWSAFFATENNLPTSQPYANGNHMYPANTSAAGYTNFATLKMSQAGKQTQHWMVFQGNAALEWTPLKGLKLKGLVSYFTAMERYKTRPRGYQLYSYNENTDTYSMVVDAQSNLFINRSQYTETLNSQLSADYSATFAGSHNVKAFVGMETYKTTNPMLYLEGKPTVDALKIAYFKELTKIQERDRDIATRLGYMARVNYDYEHRYLLELAARWDGSYKFPPHHRWGFFPSVSAGWRPSQEKFWEGWGLSSWFNDLKLRISYGVMGDDNVSGYSPFDYMGGYNYNSGGAVLDGSYVTGTQVRSLPKDNISWLKSHVFDVGVDVSLFNSRLTGSIDYFDRMRKGLPGQRYDVLIPTEVGFTWPIENLNSDRVRGFDAMVQWNDRIGEVSYSVGGTFTLARSFNWHQYKPTYANSWDYYRNSQNERYSNNSWVRICTGQFQSWEQIASWPIDNDGKGNTTMRPGDLIFKDCNRDGIIDDQDVRPMGTLGYEDSHTPIVNFGLNITAQWKGIDFSMAFVGATNITYFANWENRYPFHADANNPQYMSGNQWHLADPFDADSELIPGKYPTMLTGKSYADPNYFESTFWMKDIWYLKCRNLEVGYTLPQKWLKPLRISNFRVYFSGQNLFAFDNCHFDFDPEISDTSSFAYPTTRIYSIGFNLTF